MQVFSYIFAKNFEEMTRKAKIGMFDVSNEKYHADTKRIGSTGLKLIHRSPAHYYAAYLDPNRVAIPPNHEMILGTYAHCAIFEWKRFQKEFIGNGKISEDDFSRIIGMRKSVMNNPVAKKFMPGILGEKTIYFTDTESGALCKIRPDGLNTSYDRHVILELKTCQNASADVFGSQAYFYGYHNQAAFYVDGYVAAGLSDEKPRHWFLAVEKDPPFVCVAYQTPDVVLRLGSRENAIDLKIYIQCLKSGIWPGYDSVSELKLPDKAFVK